MAGIGSNSLGAIRNPGGPSGRLECFPLQGAFPRQPNPTAGIDRGLWLTLRAIRRQLEAMPHDLFLIRLIHHATGRPTSQRGSEGLDVGFQDLLKARVGWLPAGHRFCGKDSAHELGRTHDWVVLYYDGGLDEHQCTVVTSHWGKLTGKRIVRGREKECEEFYSPASQTISNTGGEPTAHQPIGSHLSGAHHL